MGSIDSTMSSVIHLKLCRFTCCRDVQDVFNESVLEGFLGATRLRQGSRGLIGRVRNLNTRTFRALFRRGGIQKLV